jgi:hypothetical protein
MIRFFPDRAVQGGVFRAARESAQRRAPAPSHQAFDTDAKHVCYVINVTEHRMRLSVFPSRNRVAGYAHAGGKLILRFPPFATNAPQQGGQRFCVHDTSSNSAGAI